jgi:hypothetical protein
MSNNDELDNYDKYGFIGEPVNTGLPLVKPEKPIINNTRSTYRSHKYVPEPWKFAKASEFMKKPTFGITPPAHLLSVCDTCVTKTQYSSASGVSGVTPPS